MPRAYLMVEKTLWRIESAAQIFKFLLQNLLIGWFEQKHPAPSPHRPVQKKHTAHRKCSHCVVISRDLKISGVWIKDMQDLLWIVLRFRYNLVFRRNVADTMHEKATVKHEKYEVAIFCLKFLTALKTCILKLQYPFLKFLKG